MTTDTDAELRRQRLSQTPLTRVGPEPHLLRGTWSSLRDIVQHRELLVLLVKRELRARYKNSTLGFAWSFARPVAQLLIYTLILGELLQMSRGVPQFAVFVFCGLTLWTLFNESVAGGTGAVVGNAGLVKKIYVPREVFPLSTVGGAIVNFVIQFAVLLLATIALGQAPFTADFAYVPFAVLLVIVFGTAAALFLAAVNVYLRDVQHLVEIVIMVLFWASPIVYSFSYVHEYLQNGWLEQVYLTNPVTIAVLAFQKGMWVAGPESAFPDHLGTRLAVALVVSTVLLWFSQRVFARLEGNFAQEL
ncbi:ABC transporter permease [Cellulomonas hominis]|uniref:ABC transporter permease n=1 Tax=Cellulomonas hominis TaxID=156981 RepID=UPI001443B625|nr:ABC transporter permease [Cellulomonas hominis]NKY09931.1 ABC transporter permease [Cellulomonas hominis]